MVPDERLHPVLRAIRALQGVHDAGLVPAQDLDVERGGDPVLAAEVVVDRADAGAGAPLDLLDRRLSGGVEGLQGSFEDRLAAVHVRIIF